MRFGLSCGVSLSILTQATFQIDVKEGELECPESHKVFPIHNGVANMLLNEDETEAS